MHGSDVILILASEEFVVFCEGGLQVDWLGNSLPLVIVSFPIHLLLSSLFDTISAPES